MNDAGIPVIVAQVVYHLLQQADPTSDNVFEYAEENDSLKTKVRPPSPLPPLLTHPNPTPLSILSAPFTLPQHLPLPLPLPYLSIPTCRWKS